MSAVGKILGHLDGVRQSGPGKWRARCPGHNGKSQSLAIADIDGRILIKCFAGCETEVVLNTIGLSFSDLHDKALGNFAPLRRRPWTASDVLDLVLDEVMVVGVVAANFLEKKSIDEDAWARLAQASRRLQAIAHEVSP